MIIELNFQGQRYSADLSSGICLSNLLSNENSKKAFTAPDFKIEPFTSGNFVGEIAQGSSVNFRNVFLNPHGNGTHTETAEHIYDIKKPISSTLLRSHLIGQFLKLKVENGVVSGDFWKDVKEGVEAVILEAGVSSENDFSGTNPAYFQAEDIMQLVVKKVDHLLTDLPSVDPEIDEGRLSAHKAFFGPESSPRENATITEMLVIPENFEEGLYLIDIQILNIEMDASPSRVMVYPLKKS